MRSSTLCSNRSNGPPETSLPSRHAAGIGKPARRGRVDRRGRTGPRGWVNRREGFGGAGGRRSRRPGRKPHKLMGAGVATSPHCPGSNCRAPKGQTLVAGRFGSPAEALLLRRVPFRETSARRLPSCWTSKKLGSGFPSHFFFDRPASRFLDIDPEGSPPHPRWQWLAEPPSVSGRPLSGHTQSLPPESIRRKGNPPVDK